MVDLLTNVFSMTQQLLFEICVQPAMMAMGLANFLEDGYSATAWFLLGLLQLVVIAICIGTLQRIRPVEPIIDRATVRTDILYTIIHRLGVFQLGLFFSLDPCLDLVFGGLRSLGYGMVQLDAVLPGITDQPLVSLLLYLVVYDCLNYGIHRLQHQSEWWWRLHSLHHAQRQMTMWSDNRNHLLDDLLVATLIAIASRIIGIAPEQYIFIVVFTKLSESLQHANARISFGTVGERLWVSPRFHRAHHAIGTGHESRVGYRVVLGGCNFGVLLPWWDILLGSANFSPEYAVTGVRDQVDSGRNYGNGFWSQQWLGLLRLLGKV